MRRKVHPSRPSASTCCLFSSLKTLLILPEAINLLVGVNVPDDYLMAGFEVIMNGRFWASAEDQRAHLVGLITPVRLSSLVDEFQQYNENNTARSFHYPQCNYSQRILLG